MSKITKMAAKDAERWGAAAMFYGKGAGTRRKLIGTEIGQKVATIPGYMEAFDKAFDKLDQNKFAKNAVKERKRIDRADFLRRNTRGLLTGNRSSLTTGVLVVSVAWYIAHETGYDLVIKAEIKERYRRLEQDIKIWNEKRKLNKSVS